MDPRCLFFDDRESVAGPGRKVPKMRTEVKGRSHQYRMIVRARGGTSSAT